MFCTLLIASVLDAASTNLLSSLLALRSWTKLGSNHWRCGRNFLWLQEKPLLELDLPNVQFLNLYHLDQGDTIVDIVFLSKHCAASGIPALTVHPIGIPWQIENSRSGGVPGKCSPPNMKITPFYNALSAETKRRGLEKFFQVTMEVTHHGPYVELPVCFVEIGSSEEYWSNSDAGSIWAQCLSEVLFGELSESDQSGATRKIVVVSIGGGHYCPRINDLCRANVNILAGHALATYALQDALSSSSSAVSDENPAVPTGGWRSIILEAVNSTRSAMPAGAQLICLIDKKAFSAPHKHDISSYLNEQGIDWTMNPADVKSKVQVT